MKKKDLLSASKKKLMETAAKLRIRGRSKMTKGELANAIVRAGDAPATPRRKGAKSGAGKPSEVRAERPARRRKGPIREGMLIRRSWREQQAVVQHAKYQTKLARAPRPAAVPEPSKAPTPEAEELPPAYGENRIVLLVRDPYWMHVYWDISRGALLQAKKTLKEEWSDAKSILRVYDVTGIDFDGTNANSALDIEIGGGADNWYINTGVPNRTYCVEIGLLSPSGKFVVLARSNKATTPRDAPSDVTDEEWMIPDWEFERIYALSGGFSIGSGSLELKEMMEKALGAEISSGAPSSFVISSPVGKPRARGFWFRLGAELIVYGATEPDARVTLQGRPVQLRPDGTFTVRFELPDGKQVIPAVAESADGIDRIEITPTVTKKTKRQG
jgi:hypothetical protein